GRRREIRARQTLGERRLQPGRSRALARDVDHNRTARISMFDVLRIIFLPRLPILGLLWLVCAIPASLAQSYPNKTIHFIMPYPVGGSIDIAGRMVMQK